MTEQQYGEAPRIAAATRCKRRGVRATALLLLVGVGLAAALATGGCGSSPRSSPDHKGTQHSTTSPAVPAGQATLTDKTSSDPVTNAAQLRRTYEKELEARIEADARLMVQDKIFEGPILGVTCTPMERGGKPVVASTVHFNCLAIKRRIHTSLGVTLEGARYFGEIDFATGTSTYAGH